MSEYLRFNDIVKIAEEREKLKVSEKHSALEDRKNTMTEYYITPEGVKYTVDDQKIVKGYTLEGRKDDTGKVQLELIPPELLFAVGDILTFGAKKYAPRNWEQGMKWSRVYGALMRHMWAWWKGEKCDPETGKSHLWHAGCCIAFLIAYEERKVGEDDRPV